MQPQRRQRILRQHLRTDQLLGVEAVPQGSPIPTALGQASASSPASTEKPSPSIAQRTRHTPSQSSPTLPPKVGSSPSASLWTAPMTESVAHLSREEKQRLLQKIDEQEVRNCTQCTLCQSRTQTVFGEGNPDADLMFVGEGPGRDEDLQGRPFVGPSGALLDKMIVAMGFDRQQIYIANVVKCRPPQNRTPASSEVKACGDYLLRQIAIIKPKVIVTLGGPAAKLLLETQTGITALRGTWHQFHGLGSKRPPIDLMPTFHPAYLLRSYTQDNRRKVWADLQAVIERLKK